MIHNEKISITMPDLSPEAAYALADWIATIAHEVDLHYGDHIRSYLNSRDWGQAEIDEEINYLQIVDEHQEELPF
jgi:hypothetical protein